MLRETDEIIAAKTHAGIEQSYTSLFIFLVGSFEKKFLHHVRCFEKVDDEAIVN